MRNRARGFISLRSLVALLITITLLPLATRVLTYSASIKFNYDEIEDELSLYQLRRILLVSYDIYNNYNYLEFNYKDNTCYLSEINNRLVLQPGYQMFLDKIENCYFYEEENVIYVAYTKRNKEFKSPLCKANGIYLDEFFSDDDNGDIDNDG